MSRNAIQQAKQLITQGKYAEAREILQKISEPGAKMLLRELDQLDPQPRTRTSPAQPRKPGGRRIGVVDIVLILVVVGLVGVLAIIAIPRLTGPGGIAGPAPTPDFSVITTETELEASLAQVTTPEQFMALHNRAEYILHPNLMILYHADAEFYINSVVTPTTTMTKAEYSALYDALRSMITTAPKSMYGDLTYEQVNSAGSPEFQVSAVRWVEGEENNMYAHRWRIGTGANGRWGIYQEVVTDIPVSRAR